ncbi:hypothetical protein DFJ58DRAFT_845729, partial [Suillus subalutaceus]|uniref:uncharacterized protein n=1 Tax=Suillus subalutaceus TaxID=48586 RepID=UPI001B880CE2
MTSICSGPLMIYTVYDGLPTEGGDAVGDARLRKEASPIQYTVHLPFSDMLSAAARSLVLVKLEPTLSGPRHTQYHTFSRQFMGLEKYKNETRSVCSTTCAQPPDLLTASSNASHAPAKMRHDNPSNVFDERPPKRPRVQLRVGPAPHHTPAVSSSEHLASRARQKCCGAGTAAAPARSAVKDPSPAPCAAMLVEPAAAASNGMQRSLDALDATSHKIWLCLAAEERADKGTNEAYARHVRNYIAYWDRYQAEMVADTPAWTSVPALPISAAKVFIFLNYERTREK